MKKKLFAAAAALALSAGLLAGCSGGQAVPFQENANGQTSAADGKVQVVCATFPAYDWVRQIVGDNEGRVEVSYLMGNGTDLHSYQPTVEDIAKISDADLFVYAGGESDDWARDAVEAADNPDLHTVSMLDAVGDAAVEEEVIEGMQADDEHGHEHGDAHEDAEKAPGVLHKQVEEVSTFEDSEVRDRPLSDWAGAWQSAYPFVLDGSLDEGFEHKAESGSMTAEEYKAYYATGYESDLKSIDIDGDDNTIRYTYMDGSTCESAYKYLGYHIQDWSTGTRAAMYRFEALDKESGAPVYVEFNDHIIEPCAAEHFHFRSSNTSFDDIDDPENRWPTFYPASFDAHDMLQAFVGHDHSHGDSGHHHGEDEAELDEHVWLSLRNAQVIVDAIAEELASVDSQAAPAYEANAEAYKARLAALDSRYADAVKAGPKDTVLFADRFPFRYLVDDYDLKYYAAFSGCSAETEASFETVAFLAGKVDELGLNTVLVIENSDQSIARTVIDSTKAKDQGILVLDSLQSVTQADADAGKTYLATMEDNLDILVTALA